MCLAGYRMLCVGEMKEGGIKDKNSWVNSQRSKLWWSEICFVAHRLTILLIRKFVVYSLQITYLSIRKFVVFSMQFTICNSQIRGFEYATRLLVNLKTSSLNHSNTVLCLLKHNGVSR